MKTDKIVPSPTVQLSFNKHVEEMQLYSRKVALKSVLLKRSFSVYNPVSFLTQSGDFGEQITHLFEFIQGEIESWERTGGPGVSEGKNDDGSGRVWKEIRATYDINTSEKKYHISFQEITEHSQNPDKVGVSSFCIIDADDWN